MDDVPSPIDLRNMADAQRWAASATLKRPWRRNFIEAIANELSTVTPAPQSVLELGSGPGFLAETVLVRLPEVTYVALEFSPAMHTLARQRLGRHASRVRFWTADFKDQRWIDGLPTVDAIVTIQAVHELRHKRHAPALYAQGRALMHGNGVLLMCDHLCGAGGMSDVDLYMTVQEHKAALLAGGFASVRALRKKGALCSFEPSAGRNVDSN